MLKYLNLVRVAYLMLLSSLFWLSAFSQNHSGYLFDTGTFYLDCTWDLNRTNIVGKKDTFNVIDVKSGMLYCFIGSRLSDSLRLDPSILSGNPVMLNNGNIYIMNSSFGLRVFNMKGKLYEEIALTDNYLMIDSFYYRHAQLSTPSFLIVNNRFLIVPIRPAEMLGNDLLHTRKPFFLQKDFYNPKHPIIGILDLNKPDSMYRLENVLYKTFKAENYIFTGTQDSFFINHHYSYNHAYQNFCYIQKINVLLINQRGVEYIETYDLNRGASKFERWGIKGQNIALDDTIALFPAGTADTIPIDNYRFSYELKKHEKNAELLSYHYLDIIYLDSLDLVLRFYKTKVSSKGLNDMYRKYYCQLYSFKDKKLIQEFEIFPYHKILSYKENEIYFWIKTNYTTNQLVLAKLRISTP